MGTAHRGLLTARAGGNLVETTNHLGHRYPERQFALADLADVPAATTTLGVVPAASQRDRGV